MPGVGIETDHKSKFQLATPRLTAPDALADNFRSTWAFPAIDADAQEVSGLHPGVFQHVKLRDCKIYKIMQLELLQDQNLLTTTPGLRDLHWLPVKRCIDYKVLCIIYSCVNNCAPEYLVTLVFLFCLSC